MKFLDCKIAKGSQDYILTQLYVATYEYTSGVIKQTLRHKLRITIKSDSYLQQCYARISIFSPEENKWNRLATIEPGKMQTANGLCYKQNAPGEQEFQNDIDELLRLADLILT